MMRKKIIFISVVAWIMISSLMIYGIGGSIGPWFWNINIFITGPIACLCLLIDIIITVIHLIRKKDIRWNILLLVMFLIVVYPVTILFGCSYMTYPRNEKVLPEYSMELPIENGVLKGGKENKMHASWPSECYAYDVVKEPFDMGSKNLEDYGIYLQDVIAPVDGTVISLEDTEEDILPNIDQFKSLMGNYIYIKINKTETYLILAQLEKDSVKVKVGDTVSKGMILAKVGNSGTTSEPHLHMQHQKNNPLETKIPICSQGLPIKFEGVK